MSVQEIRSASKNNIWKIKGAYRSNRSYSLGEVGIGERWLIVHRAVSCRHLDIYQSTGHPSTFYKITDNFQTIFEFSYSNSVVRKSKLDPPFLTFTKVGIF